jgi:hypothetical protein
MRRLGDGREETTPMDVDTTEGELSPLSPPFCAPLILSADSSGALLPFVRSAFCFVLQHTWWQATHVVAGEDLEAAAPGAEQQPEVRRAVFAVCVLSACCRFCSDISFILKKVLFELYIFRVNFIYFVF